MNTNFCEAPVLWDVAGPLAKVCYVCGYQLSTIGYMSAVATTKADQLYSPTAEDVEWAGASASVHICRCMASALESVLVGDLIARSIARRYSNSRRRIHPTQSFRCLSIPPCEIPAHRACQW